MRVGESDRWEHTWGREHVHMQRSDSWVVLFETGSLMVSPAPEGCPEHHPSHLKAPSVCLPDLRQRGPLQKLQEKGEGRDSTHDNQWRGLFQLKKNAYNNGGVQQTKWAVGLGDSVG